LVARGIWERAERPAVSLPALESPAAAQATRPEVEQTRELSAEHLPELAAEVLPPPRSRAAWPAQVLRGRTRTRVPAFGSKLRLELVAQVAAVPKSRSPRPPGELERQLAREAEVVALWTLLPRSVSQRVQALAPQPLAESRVWALVEARQLLQQRVAVQILPRPALACSRDVRSA